MPLKEISNQAPPLILSSNYEESYARQNLRNLSPAHIAMLTMLITHWQDSRRLISQTNKQSPGILPEFTSGEVEEAEVAIQNEGDSFDNINYSKELTDVLVYLQMIITAIGANYSINAILAAVDKKIILANSSNVYDKTHEVIGDISLLKNRELADKKAIFEVYTTILALYMSSPNLPDIVVAMYRTVRLNELNYPRDYFEINPADYNDQEMIELYTYRKALCRILRDEGMIGKDADEAAQKRNVFVFADIVLNEHMELEVAEKLLKERILKVKKTIGKEYETAGQDQEGLSLLELKDSVLVPDEEVRILWPTPVQVAELSFIRND